MILRALLGHTSEFQQDVMTEKQCVCIVHSTVLYDVSEYES